MKWNPTPGLFLTEKSKNMMLRQWTHHELSPVRAGVLIYIGYPFYFKLLSLVNILSVISM